MFLNAINTSQAMLGASSLLASVTRPTDLLQVHDPIAVPDPSRRLRLMIEGGGTIGGGSAPTSNPLAQIFANSTSPTRGSVIVDAVAAHDLLPSLEAGTIHAWIEPVEGAIMPRFNTLSLLPVDYRALMRRMLAIDQWSEWMPNFERSQTTEMIDLNTYVQEAKTAAEVRHFHYRVLVKKTSIEGGEQIVWHLHQDDDFQIDEGHSALATNSGSWTFMPVPDNPQHTLMAYQIHMDIEANAIVQAFMGATRMLIERVVLNKFPEVVQAMANRTKDPKWVQARGTNPSEMTYTMNVIR